MRWCHTHAATCTRLGVSAPLDHPIALVLSHAPRYVYTSPLRKANRKPARPATYVSSVHATATLADTNARRGRRADDDAGGGRQRRRLFRTLLPILVSCLYICMSFIISQVTALIGIISHIRRGYGRATRWIPALVYLCRRRGDTRFG